MAVGVSLLIVVLSIFNGFQKQVKESLWNGGPHVTIENNYGTGEIKNYEKVISVLLENEELKKRIVTIQGNITSHGLLQNNNTFVPIMIRAIPVEDTKSLMQNEIPNFPRLEYYNRESINTINSNNTVVIGKEMFNLYGFHLGRAITIAVPSGSFNVTRGVELNVNNFEIVGLFKTGYYNYDSKFVYLSLPVAQKFFKLNNSVNQLTLKVKSLDELEYVKELILDTIREIDFNKKIESSGNYFIVKTIAEEQANFLAALRMEKTIISNIVFLFIILAALGMVATVYSLVRSKRKSIGILKALGLPSSSILLIFTLNSMIIGLLSSVIGGIIGVYYANNLETIINGLSETINFFGPIFYKSSWRNIELVPKDIYYFDHLPVDIDISFIFMVTTASTILSGLAGYFPARWAANLDPVETIKND
ncbi:MAG: ABC transporter permease [Leptospiraceae bacterium]|nr:ABC transporter permease [Leptospiraceae bacterium]MCP5512927.1 ABC transporter permease [Leptospiraceae bacterium]